MSRYFVQLITLHDDGSATMADWEVSAELLGVIREKFTGTGAPFREAMTSAESVGKLKDLAKGLSVSVNHE